MNKKIALTTLGFIFLIMGFLSGILMIVNVQFSFLKWMDFNGRGLGLVIRLAMIIGGFILIYFFAGDRQEA